MTEFFVTREKRATFRQVPGTARLRPKAATGLPGLVLAGSWTDTGWPDTMEGAVRSGLNAVIALQLTSGGTPPRTPRDAPDGSAIVSGARPEAEVPEEETKQPGAAVPEVETEAGAESPEEGTNRDSSELAENAASEVSKAEVNTDANEREVRS